MYTGFGAWHFIGLFVYIAVVAAGVFALYWIIRLAVLHALKAHTKWLDAGKP